MRLEIDERPPARVVDALGNVGGNRGSGRGRNRRRRDWLLQEDGAEKQVKHRPSFYQRRGRGAVDVPGAASLQPRDRPHLPRLPGPIETQLAIRHESLALERSERFELADDGDVGERAAAVLAPADDE